MAALWFQDALLTQGLDCLLSLRKHELHLGASGHLSFSWSTRELCSKTMISYKTEERSLQENDKESNQHFGKAKTRSRLKSHRNVVVGLKIGKPCNKNPKCYQICLQWSNGPKCLHSKVKTLTLITELQLLLICCCISYWILIFFLHWNITCGKILLNGKDLQNFNILQRSEFFSQKYKIQIIRHTLQKSSPTMYISESHYMNSRVSRLWNGWLCKYNL